MTGNKLKQMLAEGRIAVGATVQIPAAALVEILGRAGFDFTMIDIEHGMFSVAAVAELIRTAQGAGLTPLVRVLSNEPEAIMKVLDLGAQGVVIPHVSTAQDAIRAVEACRYGPGGRRGACPLIRANQYGLGDWERYQERANADTMIVALVEDLQGADRIEEILAVEGIDGVFLGPFDMSVSAGHRGNVEHPEIQAAVDKVLAACSEKGVVAMCSLRNCRDVDALVSKGVRMILQTADSYVFARACAEFLASVSHLRNVKTGE